VTSFRYYYDYQIKEAEMGGACSGQGGGEHKILVGRPEGKRSLGRPDIGGRTILKWILRNYGWSVQIGFIWLRIGTGGGLL
jgi:hypothetical protein